MAIVVVAAAGGLMIEFSNRALADERKLAVLLVSYAAGVAAETVAVDELELVVDNIDQNKQLDYYVVAVGTEVVVYFVIEYVVSESPSIIGFLLIGASVLNLSADIVALARLATLAWPQTRPYCWCCWLWCYYYYY